MRPLYTCDTECYSNYWSIGFTYEKDPSVTFGFYSYNDSPIDRQAIIDILKQVTIVTFNGNHYDENMILYMLLGANNAQLKAMNDLIIQGGAKPWEIRRNFNFEAYFGPTGRPDWLDHIDLKEVAPGVGVSLKIYAGRMHSELMQDLPIDFDKAITDADLALMDSYRGNDESNTLDLLNKVRERVDLRINMSERYGIDLRSKSDAQIAEAVIKKQLGFYIEKPFWPHHTKFNYIPAPFLKYDTQLMNDVFSMVKNAVFMTSDKDQVYESDEVDDNGKPIKIKTGIIMPEEIKQCRIAIGNSVYKFGIGGLHSTEKGKSHRAINGWTLSDHDVISYYPKIIINGGYYPKQMGPQFTQVYSAIVDERVDAKGNMQFCKKNAYESQLAMSVDHLNYWQSWGAYYKNIEGSLKIVINGSFGKFGSKYSILFSPDLLIQTTITGQLSLLMLIEQLEMAGISVVSANTDGIVVLCPPGMQALRDEIITRWEHATNFKTEQADYSGLFSRDVNNYIAVTTKGEVKAKGVFAPPTLMKSPNNTVCVEAVVNYITAGTPIADTIMNCTDIRKFVTIRGVKGGAIKDDVILGKAVRWYYAINEMGCITYRINGNRVPRSEGARPCMRLPSSIPADIDYNWYIREANAKLIEVGFK